MILQSLFLSLHLSISHTSRVKWPEFAVYAEVYQATYVENFVMLIEVVTSNMLSCFALIAEHSITIIIFKLADAFDDVVLSLI